MRTAAENQKEILASTPNTLCGWIGHQTYWDVFAWTPGMSRKGILSLSLFLLSSLT